MDLDSLPGSPIFIRYGTFESVDELERAIMDYLDPHNAQPKPFVWTRPDR